MRYSHLTKLASYFYMTASFQRSVDAWWMTPDGKFIEVPPGLHHDHVAAELLGVEYPNVEENDYLAIGGIKFRILDKYLYIELSVTNNNSFETLKQGVILSGLPNSTYVILTINDKTKSLMVGDIVIARSFKDIFS